MNSYTSSSEIKTPGALLVRIAAFLTGLALLCVLVSCLLNSSLFEGTYITAQNYKLHQIAKHGHHDFIIMGDSTAMAIDITRPETQKVLAGGAAFNLALVNLGGIYPLYSTLKKYLAGGPPPDTVLISFLPTLLSGKSDILNGSKFTKFYAAKLYSARDIFTDPEIRKRKALVADLLYEKYKFRLLQYKYDIPRDERMIRRLKATKGQLLVLENTMTDVPHTLASGQYRAEFGVSPASDAYFRKFLNLARENGINVMFFTIPVPTAVAEHRAAIGYDKAFYGYLEKLTLDFPNFHYTERNLSLPPEYFSADATHLNKWGADEFQKRWWPGTVELAVSLRPPLNTAVRTADVRNHVPTSPVVLAGAISRTQ